MRILVVEDDEIFRTLLTQRLNVECYAIDVAKDGVQGWEYASTYEYDLLILDLVLPKLDGISLCQKLRHAGYTLPILMLTSQDTSTAKIMGLDAGADDYMVKPFDEPELIARIRALLRRGSSNPLPTVICGPLSLNSSTHEVFYGEMALTLTAKEYALLEMMMRDSHHVFGSDEILESLWSSEEFPVDATVRSHMRRLRNKLTAVGAPPDLIATSHGRGYYLKILDLSTSTIAPARETPNLVTGNSPIEQSKSNELTQQTQYLELLNDTWQKHRSTCLERVELIRSTLDSLHLGQLTSPIQAEAYRAAHTLVGTLGTFGLDHAMRLARNLDQELHPDLYLEPYQAEFFRSFLNQLQQQIEQTLYIENLPTMVEDRPQAIEDSKSKPLQPEIRVLMVDNDPFFLETFPQYLKPYGFQVLTLNDPRQFWSVLESNHPDVLILDIQMPQINGFELCQGLRSVDPWQKIPVMFLSADSKAETQHKAFSVGADDYLCKPITAESLSDRIHNRLQRIHSIMN
ncbi:MAG: response regulator [Cyanobacteria bacterium]|nr:response regulator [Cyanobacteriota bacterium]